MQVEARPTPLVLALVLAGTGAATSCARTAESEPSIEMLGDCLRKIQRAQAGVLHASTGLTREEAGQADVALVSAEIDVLHAWAVWEGMTFTRGELAALDTVGPRLYVQGIWAEAGLSDEERSTAYSENQASPERWRNRYNQALDCAERLAP